MKKVTMLAAMLAIMLAMAAAPALAQDEDDVQDITINCPANGGTAIADASGGDVVQNQPVQDSLNQLQGAQNTQSGVATDGSTVNQNLSVEQDQSLTATLAQYGVAGDGGTATATASGGSTECPVTINNVHNGDIVTGDSVIVKHTVINGDKVLVFKDEAGLLFTVVGNKAIPLDERGVVVGTKTVGGATTAVDVAYADSASVGTKKVAGTTTSVDVASVAGLKVLPDTGGVSLITLGGGALLLASGLLLRRIIR